jgi:hypothetical protein
VILRSKERVKMVRRAGSRKNFENGLRALLEFLPTAEGKSFNSEWFVIQAGFNQR